MMERTYSFGAFVVRPDGELDTIAGLSDRLGREGVETTYRLRWGGPATWYGEGQLRAAKYVDFRRVSLEADVRPSDFSRSRAVVEGRHGRSRGAGAHVFTPCCGAGHYTKSTQDSVTCRGCGWMYLVAHFSVGTFFMSLGFGKPLRRYRRRGV
jgi:hypothetical protein